MRGEAEHVREARARQLAAQQEVHLRHPWVSA